MDHVNNAAYVDYLDEVLAARPEPVKLRPRRGTSSNMFARRLRAELLTAIAWGSDEALRHRRDRHWGRRGAARAS